MRRATLQPTPTLGTAAAMVAAACIPCLAQQATVVVSHNDPVGIVAPGETVQISVTVSWTGAWYLQEIKGSVRSSPDVGVAANNVFPHLHYASNPWVMIIDPGEPSGGSVLGMHIFTGAQMWVALGSVALPWSLSTGIEVLRFDWTAPNTPGVVEFDFIPDPSLPVPTFLDYQSLSPFPLPTTYIGTSLTVIPAPGAGVALAAGVAGFCTRRRRGRR